MNFETQNDINLLRDFSSIFTRSEAQLILKGNLDTVDFKIKRYYNRIPQSALTSYSKFLKHCYNVLEQHYQNEYVIKNSFLTNWLIKELGKSSSVVFNEFRIGKSVSDLAMFNGVSRAFEIKTEYDSEQRLKDQIKNYKEAFNEIYLIIPKSKLETYKKYGDGVGIILFDSSKNEKFEYYRKARYSENLNPAILMQILNTNEYKMVVQEYFGVLPSMNSFDQYKKCFDLIKSIPIVELNQLFLEQIKKRKLDNVLSTYRYKELNQISLALKLRKKEKRTLIKNLKQPIFN
ncbi:sce7726 family protein [Luteirhabdus pelagi]|uniref:sce7726 family protein n=1 Tax=Luteirhabdus pelagi TaxID=2792783 RepID=UPI00193A9DD5|nr:sce7726 family protein [Luteirhabdus pelagi]